MAPSKKKNLRFEILQLLGKGGVGEVFLAEDHADGRKIALKFLTHPTQGLSLEFFQEEVRLLSHLSHPNLVKIFDFYPVGDDLCSGKDFPPRGPFFSMEYIPGRPLDGLSPDLPAQQAIEFFVDLCQGLHYLHRRNILHRDLKPSNVVVTPSGQIKILDFGLSTMNSSARPAKGAMGTLAYLAPETYGGDFGVASDLFSLGVLFYEVLTGKLPFHRPLTPSAMKEESHIPLKTCKSEIPEYFTDLIERLLAPSPSDRPHSAAAMIRYLNQHVDLPFQLFEEEDSQAILEKVPLVGRVKELEELFLSLKSRDKTSPLLFEIGGPTGIGRSRFLEEIKWKLQLEGIACFPVLPPRSRSWSLGLAGQMGLIPSHGETGNLLEVLRSFLKRAEEQKTVLAFHDLQEWSEEALKELSLFLKMAGERRSFLGLVLEFASDRITPTLENFLSFIKSIPSLRGINLKDLSPEQSHDLIAGADVGFRLSSSKVDEIVQSAGGRPLLILEGLRSALQGGPWAVPKSLQEAASLRVEGLSERARDLLSCLVVHPESVTGEEASDLIGPSSFLEETLLELDQKGFLSPRNPDQPSLSLAQSSLRDVILQALGRERVKGARQRWVRLLKNQSGEEPRPIFEATLLTEQALALEEFPLAKKWGYAAGEFYSGRGEEAKALEIYRNLLNAAETPFERCYANAHLAPAYLRLGRFEEALTAYERWYEEREDDESRTQKVKYHLFTGQVYEVWGKTEEAQRRLEECLKTGDPQKFPAHRSYHARAHIRLGVLAEKAKDLRSAQKHLENALTLSEEFPLVLGEIEQNLARLHRDRMEYEPALASYEKSLEYYRRAGSPQGEAQPAHSIGMLHRELGELSLALGWIEKSIALAEQGGEILQIARYQFNRALVFLEMARYGRAQEAMEKVRPVLEALGNDSDRLTVKIHQLILARFLGNKDLQEKISAELIKEESKLFSLGLKPWFHLIRAEGAYFERKFPDVLEILDDLESARDWNPEGKEALEADLLRLRLHARLQGLSKQGAFVQKVLANLEPLSGPLFQLWRDVFTFLKLPEKERREKGLAKILKSLKTTERVEWRRDLYSLLAGEFERCGLKNLALSLQRKAQETFQKIFHLLPEEFKMDFEKNRPLEEIDETVREIVSASEKGRPSDQLPEGPRISEARFRQLSEIIRQIARKNDLAEILERVIDAAIELTGAERGFLILKNDGSKGQPFKGFEVATARHLNHRSLTEEQFQFSLSAVKEAVGQGSSVLTDNARADERFQAQKSVLQFQLTSILVTPLELEGKILGAIYLDHRFRPQCFSEEDVVLLSTFAAQAALAIERVGILQELKKAKEQLERKVEVQAQDIEVLRSELIRAREDLQFEYPEIVGKAPAMMEVFRLLDHITETNIPVWIWGESGSGKELIARSLHYNSSRKKNSFVTENVSAIPETLLESELFGHKKGAFTHADRDRIGLFEQASGGTLFLDEIGDMPLSMQAKLLRVLQENEIRPLGSNKKIKVDIRLVTASHRDLKKMVKEGKFREDLFYRINGLTIPVPGLRERKEDIPLLTDYLLKKAAREHNLPLSEISSEAFQILMKQDWPGNIRELEGVLRNALLFAKGKTITPEFFQWSASTTSLSSPAEKRHLSFPRRETPEELQKILQVLKKFNLDKTKAAEELGFSLRTLYSRLEAHGVPKKKGQLVKYLGL